MAIDRPTFHESWHRVARLRPRLHAGVQSFRQHFRGRRWHVLRDRATGRFHRLDEANYHFVGLLDGRRTVEEAWVASCEWSGDAAPTQGEAVALLGQLYTVNLLEADLPGDAAGMLERRNKRVRREVRHYVTNVLFAKIPLWDPDRFLDRWTPLLGWCFGPVGVALWAVLLAAGLSALAGRAGELWSQTGNVLAPDNLLWLYVAMAATKLVHELGHGIACKRFGQQEDASGSGGEVHVMGLMLLVLVPVPYVDASSAWALRSRWRRAFVGAAGMYAELAIAAAAAILWANTAAGTALHALAFNAIFVAGVSTLLFNANPLIRFDGYYILSDLTETPNLAQRANEKLRWAVKRYAYGVKKPRNPAHSRVEGVWLTVYGVAALIYRVWLSVTIFLFVADKLFFIGALMAIMALIGWVVLPLGRFVRYLASSPELLKVRRRAVLATVAPLGFLLIATGLVPVPEHGRTEGVVEPVRMAEVHAGVSGFVRRTLASGTMVAPGGRPLMTSRNEGLVARRDRLAAQLDLLEVRYRQALGDERASAQAIGEQVRAVRRDLRHAEEQFADLTVEAPFRGAWLCGDAARVHGRYVERGELLGVVADLDELSVRAVADQFLGPRLVRALEEGQAVELRVKGRPDLAFEGRVVRVLLAGQRELPSAALGHAAGGALPLVPDDRTGTQAAEPYFEVRIDLEDPAEASWLRAGQRVVARFELPAAPLLVQGWRWTRQLLQERFHI